MALVSRRTLEMAALYALGRSTKEIGRMYGMTGEAVRQRLAAAEVPRRPRGRLSDAERESWADRRSA